MQLAAEDGDVGKRYPSTYLEDDCKCSVQTAKAVSVFLVIYTRRL
jgi:hypothetical protein